MRMHYQVEWFCVFLLNLGWPTDNKYYTIIVQEIGCCHFRDASAFFFESGVNITKVSL